MDKLVEQLGKMSDEKRRYTLRTLPEHIAKAGQGERLRSILTNFVFMEAKVAVLGPQALIQDYEGHLDSDLVLLRRLLQREAHILAAEPEMLPSHLYTMLLLSNEQNTFKNDLLVEAHKAISVRPWLRLANKPEIGASREALIRVLEHGTKITAIAWSPDGQVLASAGEDQRVALWNARSGERQFTLAGHTKKIQALKWSLNGPLLASGSDDQSIRLWNPTNGQCIFTMESDQDVRSIIWEPHGHWLAALSMWSEAKIPLWNPVNGARLASLTCGRQQEFSADRRWLAVLSKWEEKIAWLVNPLQGEQHTVLTDVVGPMAWSPNSRNLAVADSKDSIWLYDILTEQARCIRRAHTEKVTCLDWSPDSTLLASGSRDGIINVWKCDTGTIHRQMAGHWDDGPGPKVGFQGRSRRHPITGRWVDRDTEPEVTGIAWSPSQAFLASCGKDNTVRIWDATTGTEKAAFRDMNIYGARMAWSPNGSFLAIWSKDKPVHIWSVSKARITGILTGDVGEVNDLEWAPDGKLLATVSQDAAVRIWDATVENSGMEVTGHTHSIYSQAFSPNGRLFATTSQDSSIRLWQPETGKQLGVLIGFKTDIYSTWAPVLCWSPNSAWLATTDSKFAVVRIWDVAQRKLSSLLRSKENPGLAKALAWSPNSKLLATAHDTQDDDDKGQLNNRVRLWDAHSEKLKYTLEGHTRTIQVLAWSPDGRFLASGGDDANVRVWDMHTGIFGSKGKSGKLRYILEGHIHSVRALAWSPDGTWLTSSEWPSAEEWEHATDVKVIVWDISTGKWYLKLPWTFFPLSWSPSGKLLATRGGDYMVTVWNVREGKLISILEGQTETERTLGIEQIPESTSGSSEASIHEQWSVSFYVRKGNYAGLTLVWSPDERILAISGQDESIRLWDVRTGTSLGVVHCLSPVCALHFSQDSHLLYAADNGSATGNHPICYVFELCNTLSPQRNGF